MKHFYQMDMKVEPLEVTAADEAAVRRAYQASSSRRRSSYIVTTSGDEAAAADRVRRRRESRRAERRQSRLQDIETFQVPTDGTVTGGTASLGRQRDSLSLVTLLTAEQRGLRLHPLPGETMTDIDRVLQVDIINRMAISIQLKRNLRARVFEQLQDRKSRELSSFFYQTKLDFFRWKRSAHRNLQELSARLTLWRGAFKSIEGHFGSGVLTYFRFLKWLWILNVIIFSMVFLFIVLPMAVFPALDYYSQYLTGLNTSSSAAPSTNLSALYCSALYHVPVNASDVLQLGLDFFIGTGWMEKTAMFYGYYGDKEVVITGLFDYNYNLPLAYLITTAAVFIVSLAFIVHNTAALFRESLMAEELEYKPYSNSVFAAWDYGVEDYKNSRLIHMALYRQITAELAEEREAARRAARDTGARCRIATLRALCHLLVILLLGLAGFIIYLVTTETVTLITSPEYDTYDQFVKLLIQFLTSIVLTVLNALLPVIFKKIVKFEDYTPTFQVNITLIRTVFLKLATLAVLISTLYNKVTCANKDVCGVADADASCDTLRCWETTFGQEMYKLVLMDFFVVCGKTFLVEFPRKVLVDRCVNKLTQLVGHQDFDIPQNVLDLIYSQVLLWLGTFFAPMIPAICVLKFFLIFYIKMLTTMVNYKPSNQPYRASDSNRFFLLVLLIAFILCTVPIIYVVYSMSPSRGCGPFRIYDHVYSILPVTMTTWPPQLTDLTEFVSSAAFQIPAYMVLVLVIYYLRSQVSAFRDMLTIMKEQLQMESRDKQYLNTKIQGLTKGDKSLASPRDASKRGSKLAFTKMSKTQSPRNLNPPVITTTTHVEETHIVHNPVAFEYDGARGNVHVAMPAPIAERSFISENSASQPPHMEPMRSSDIPLAAVY